MELSEDQIIEKYSKKWGHCNQNLFLPYECEQSCSLCNYNAIKRKNELSRKSRKKINFTNRLNYGEQKNVFRLCG